MEGWTAQLSLWSVCVIVAVVVQHVDQVAGCNVREIVDIVQRRFREEVDAQCGSIGDKCSFDRECCKGLECLMSASHDGVGLSCQRAWLADPDRGDMVFEMPDSSPTDPKSEDANWMTFKSEEAKEEEDHQKSTEDNNEKIYPTDVLTEIENLRQKKQLKLLRENYELEKLFTEREAKELEQLRALRDDAEIDEVRRLKELRLKRKMQLINELKELRGLKAAENFNALQELKKGNKSSGTDEELPIKNQTYHIDDNDNTNSNPSNVLQSQSPDTAPDPEEQENIPKHKQGIHEIHHKRKHHHHKRKGQHESLNPTNQTQDANPEEDTNLGEYNTG